MLIRIGKCVVQTEYNGGHTVYIFRPDIMTKEDGYVWMKSYVSVSKKEMQDAIQHLNSWHVTNLGDGMYEVSEGGVTYKIRKQ